MSIYRVSVDGRDYTVEIPDPDGRPVRAMVDGYVFEVEVAPADQRAPADQAPADRRAPVDVPASADGAARSKVAAGAAVERSSGDAVPVTAPLPGTIVSISVSAGDRVVHGQELCVLEAMKMNNPIRATQAGVVKEILVSVGQQVQHGNPLLVMTEV